MSDTEPRSLTGHFEFSADDLVQPFQIEGLGIRGRVVRLGPLVDRVLTRHAYPEPVSRLLGEAIALTAMIGSALKFKGRFTLQTQGKGPVRMLVADYETGEEGEAGHVRGYAQLDDERLAANLAAGHVSTADLLGEGYLAMTIDQGEDMERYQGIVALDTEGLSHAAHEYFASSEQVATRIRLAAGPLYRRDASGHAATSWRAGAIMIQHIARDGGLTGHREAEDQSPPSDEEENWNRASILIDTVEDHELLDPELAPTRLLYRLFHEDGVRAYDPADIAFGCRCSRERMGSVIRSFGRDEIEELATEGVIEATCEFCSEVYRFAEDELKEGME
ncbi:MAG TPA: Hsp33 family molecular chaperone [Parvibaculum sp.]|uniref:Hsp33 family molecular chaperone n=1 Tax=Parvibaculum sp. TaxID=2024848 RepID=UPI002CAF7322|nr:Hsp33 family molecular chaperone [Parvibaculum sp.]HMM15041.1 Hsp33 family molecular chaperone [Parvibaculum sp.]